MPSSRPQAAFEPIAPDLDLKALVESTPNFEWASRIHCDMIEYHGIDQFERLILGHVVVGGKPLVIEGYERRLDKWTFAVQWLRDNCGQKVVDVRELNKDTNVPMTMEHYLRHMAALTNQWNPNNYKEEGRQRMYLKDMDCPQIWHDKLKDQIPLGLFYLNESIGDIDGFGAIDEPDESRPGTRTGRGAAKAGDLMSSLPKEMRAENLMCYIGHEGTYTPAHREMCASLGHNIMVEASKPGVEDGKLAKPGSSIWFMTETKEREVVSEYWLSRLGHDIEVEKHFAQLNAWKHAPFKTYVVEQKPGDFILIPPLAPHQVWNRGTRTMKVAWNKTTVETLEMALNEALFKARFVCRDEQYKNKAIIYYTLQKYAKLLRIADKHKTAGIRTDQSDLKVQQLEKDFRRLHAMYTKIMVSESFDPQKPEKKVEMVPFDSNITCSYCRCNIFNRFLTCTSCVDKLPSGDDDTYDICMECYAMGRSCACISKLQWVEQFEWNHLTQLHDQFRKQIISIDKKVDSKSPKSFNMELTLLAGKRTLAQICQLELSRRPWHDISKDAKQAEKDNGDVEREEEIELDINGNVKKTKKKIRRSEKYIREHARCHVDCYWEPKWKQAHCSKCDKHFCYGNLFRAYDEMPQDILANPDWACPSCRKICGCRHCRNKPGYKKYTPKGTLLGHNTKAIADPRSVESLVDFSHSNIAWIQKAGDDHEENTLRLLRRRKEAEIAKSHDPLLSGEDYVAETIENVEERVLQLAQQEGIPIDPALAMDSTPRMNMDIEDEDAVVEHPEVPRHALNGTPEVSMPQEQWVPEGGIIWDSAHAYDSTDAITYVYPDLGTATSSQLPPAPTEGYQPIVPGYEELVPNGPDKIEMVDRKRKRPIKTDDGDRPYQSKKAKPKPKTKSRKSLVVRLVVNKEKLAEIESTANREREALPISTAPVIGSDLQALNNDYQTPEIAVAPRKTGTERMEEDEVSDGHDEEFTPVRYRDRRKPVGDGIIRPPPDADITRRATRMQAVTYADPSDGEEEFNEIVPKSSATSKLATMERAVQNLDGSADDKPHTTNVKDHSQNAAQLSVHKLADTPLVVDDTPTTSVNSSPNPPVPSPPKATSVRLGNLVHGSKSTSPTSTESFQISSRVVAQAQANRRAKMAAIEGEESNSESAGDITAESSDEEVIDEPAPAPPPPTRKPSVGSKAPKLSLPSTTMSRVQVSLPKPASKPTPPIPPPKAIPIQKVSAADWDDSSSDEDIPFTKQIVSRPATGFMSVNGNRSATPTSATIAKKRGRPPMVSWNDIFSNSVIIVPEFAQFILTPFIARITTNILATLRIITRVMESLRLLQRRTLQQLTHARPLRTNLQQLRLQASPLLRTSATVSKTQTRSLHTQLRLPSTKPQTIRNILHRTKRSFATSTEQPTQHLSLSQRLKKLSREYGWTALGVYLLLSALDFPFCFLAVRLLGTDRIGHWEHVVVSKIKEWVKWPLGTDAQEKIDGAVYEVEKMVKEAIPVSQSTGHEQRILEEDTTYVVVDHGYKEAKAAVTKADASLWTQLALAYAIHKSFIFIRVPLTAAVLPKVVKTLRSWGYNIGKMPKKAVKGSTPSTGAGVNTTGSGVKSN